MKIIHALNIAIMVAIIAYAAAVGSWIGAGIWVALLTYYVVGYRRLSRAAKED